MVSASLLDVNVLIASVDEGHVAYKTVHAWLRESAGRHWATCPLTQAGFVRIISNRRFHEQAVNVAEAFELLRHHPASGSSLLAMDSAWPRRCSRCRKGSSVIGR